MLARGALLCSLCITHAASADWTHFARSQDRIAVAAAAPVAVGSPAWVLNETPGGEPVEFAGQAGIVVHGGRAFGIAKVGGAWSAVAASVADGVFLWAAPVPPPHAGSWSAPAVDAVNGVVLIASGKAVRAFDVGSGSLAWEAVLLRPVVNASPLVTSDRGPADRAFITDYDGFGDEGRLYCINIDPHHPALNPHQPGEIVWAAPIGTTSGNTPAYSGGAVYTGAPGEGGFGPGRVHAFDAADGSWLWTFENVKSAGFFGGVCVSGGHVYAASYAFSGGRFSANLVKLDAETGGLVWSADANRTASTPIPLPGGRIVLAGGVHGFGSLPTLQMFQDHGGTVELLWDSAAATWQDANGNGLIDPGEYLEIGGWTHQPCALLDAGATLLYAGRPPLNAQEGAHTDLYLLDLDLPPGSGGFVAGHFAGAGSTPAFTDSVLLTVGDGGLHAFGGGCPADCDTSGILNLFDFLCFANLFNAGDGRADCDGSGGLNLFDFLCFVARFNEGCG